MTREDADFIGAMNMCDEISDEAYKKIMCHCEEQQPCEDAISREVAIRWVKTECNPYGKPTLDFESGKKVIEHLKQMPSVAPKQKTGKWNVLGLDDLSDVDLYKCSECNLKITRKFNYCLNCGAKMEVKNDT